MRAKLIRAAPLPARFEWVIVSRWGQDGEHLALGWTVVPADAGAAPIHLVPRQASMGRRVERAGTSEGIHFQLLSAIPEAVTVAGDFVPAKGQIRLFGDGVALHLESKGRSLRPELRPSWRIEAVRQPWFGEFVDEDPG